MDMKRLGLADLKRLRLRDWVIALLGLWMLVSPRVLHFAVGQSSEIWCAWLVGAAILLVTAGTPLCVASWSPWEEGTNPAPRPWLEGATRGPGASGDHNAR